MRGSAWESSDYCDVPDCNAAASQHHAGKERCANATSPFLSAPLPEYASTWRARQRAPGWERFVTPDESRRYPIGPSASAPQQWELDPMGFSTQTAVTRDLIAEIDAL